MDIGDFSVCRSNYFRPALRAGAECFRKAGARSAKPMKLLQGLHSKQVGDVLTFITLGVPSLDCLALRLDGW